jgi:DNA-binding protein Fis
MATAEKNSRRSDHPYNLRSAIERFERGYLQNILVLADWDQMRAAKMLGVRPKTLEGKLKKYELW